MEPLRRSARWALKPARTRPMPSQNDFDRHNDRRFLTPLLLMASIVAIAILIYAYTGHSLAAGA
jgi:hypothetical protein